MPTKAELLALMQVVRLPLRAAFRGVTERELVLFEGPSGWGEFAPFLEHTDAHAAKWLAAAIEQAFGNWPATVRDRVPVNAILPDVDPHSAAQWAERAVAEGFTTFKLKVGVSDADFDVARVQTVRGAIGDANLRIDANGRWSLATAREVLPRLLSAAGDFEFVEQPCSALGDCAALRNEFGVRVAVDESIRLDAAASDALRDSADVLVLKAIPLGGVKAALTVAGAVDLPCVVSGSLDSRVGLSAGVQLAACLPQLPYACGLGTGVLLAEDLVESEVSAQLAPGRVAPVPLRLRRLAAPAERVQYWQERLSRCYDLLESA